mgnify:CR=1 FL=1
MERSRLELDFLDEMNKRFRLSIDDPRDDLDPLQVEAAIDAILSNNVFDSNGVDLVEIEAARIVRTIVEEIEF